MRNCDAVSTGDLTIARSRGVSGTTEDLRPRLSPWDAVVPVPSSGPPLEKSSKRVVVKKVTADDVLRSFNTWAFKREQPADPQLMSQIVAEAISLERPISFVLYWGKGPRCRPAEPEVQCLDFLAGMTNRMRQVYAPGAVVELICTDTHATLNGHSADCIRAYFAAVSQVAGQRGFQCCRLSDLTRAQTSAALEPDDEIVPEDTLARLANSARKWYRGEGPAEQGALDYYQMNMIEKRAVELAFPRSIFVTFSGSELRSLFPKCLPIFYMYSVRRGVSSKPWFLPSEATGCDIKPCQCAAFAG
jgi:L-tyrosine isonitrile synthase